MSYNPLNPNGQATMANSSPVVIASNQSAVPVDLGANNDVTVTNATAANLKVDGSDVTQPVSGTVTANLSGTDNAVLDTIASPVATVSATPLQRVAVFDASDTQITSFGGGTQYTEDAAAAANPVGNAMILVREDARAGSLTTADGDNVAARGNNKGELYVKTTDSDALLTTIDADTSSIATDASTIAGKDFATETTLASLNGKVTAVNTGAVVVSSSALPSGASTAAKQPALGTAGTASADVITVQGIASMTALKVDGSAVTQPVSGTVSITSNSAVNVAQMNGVATSMGNGASGTGVQRVTMANDSTGILAGVTTVTTLTGGGVASGSSDSGNPHKIGGQARTTNPTAVTDGQRVNFIADKLGKQVVVGSIRDLKAPQTTTITSSTSETTIGTAVASTFLDLYGLIITNTSATAVNVAIKDSTAGTTRMNIGVPAGETRGFMLPESAAWTQSAVNNNWTATSSASVASLVIAAFFIKNT